MLSTALLSERLRLGTGRTTQAWPSSDADPAAKARAKVDAMAQQAKADNKMLDFGSGCSARTLGFWREHRAFRSSCRA